MISNAYWLSPKGMYGTFGCSECGNASDTKKRYCSYCGARMLNATMSELQTVENRKDSEGQMSAEKRAYGAYSVKVNEYPLYHLSGVVMSDDMESGFTSFFDRDGDEILRVRQNRLVSVLRVDKGEALLGMPYEATVNANNNSEKRRANNEPD